MVVSYVGFRGWVPDVRSGKLESLAIKSDFSIVLYPLLYGLSFIQLA